MMCGMVFNLKRSDKGGGDVLFDLRVEVPCASKPIFSEGNVPLHARKCQGKMERGRSIVSSRS